MLAAEALAAGLDSPALREAAGVPVSEVQDARDRFIEALGELGVEVPDEQEALWQLVRFKAAQIVSGEVTPYEGASWIWREAHPRIEREGDLRIFIGLASEWEDHRQYRPEIERRIVDEALMLLEKTELRRWVKLQARSGCWPLWDPKENRSLGHDEPALRGELRADLRSWADEFDRVQAHPGPGPSHFADQPAAEDFVERGRQLVQRVQDELGDGWHVEYMQTPSAFPRA